MSFPLDPQEYRGSLFCENDFDYEENCGPFTPPSEMIFSRDQFINHIPFKMCYAECCHHTIEHQLIRRKQDCNLIKSSKH